MNEWADRSETTDAELTLLSRAELEARVRERTAALRNVMDAMVDVLLKLDSDGRIELANEALEAVLGYEPDEVVGKPVDYLVADSDEAGDEATLLQDGAFVMNLVLEGAVADVEVGLSTADGDVVPVSLSTSVMTDEAGAVEGFVCVAKDVSERTAAERRLARERDLKEAIRNTLVEVSTQHELEAAFCSNVVDDRHPLAWVGERTPSDVLAVRAIAGADSYLDALGEIPTDGSEPSARAISAAEPVVVQDVTAVDATWAEAAVAADLRSVVAIPLAREGLHYGVLSVYARRANEFTTDRRRLVEDLAESLAYAIHTARERESLHAERLVELTLDVRRGDSYLVSAARDDRLPDDARLEVHEVRTDAEETVSHFVRVVDAALPDPERFFESFDPVVGAEPVASADGTTLRLVVRSPTIVAAVTDLGGAMDTLVVSRNRVRLVARFSSRADVQAVIEQFRERFPGTTVVSLTHVDADAGPEAHFHPALSEKQLDALRTAYVSGFFDRPQRNTATEVAALLDVARSTFLRHLRSGERTVFAGLFDGESEL